jgi:hypothetical protein
MFLESSEIFLTMRIIQRERRFEINIAVNEDLGIVRDRGLDFDDGELRDRLKRSLRDSLDWELFIVVEFKVVPHRINHFLGKDIGITN